MLGISTTAYTAGGFEEWACRAKEAGFQFVELLNEWPNRLTAENWRTFKEVLDSCGLGLTLHAPFSDINIASFNERIRRASLEEVLESVRIGALMDALVVTIHPGHCSPISVKNRGAYLKIHRKSLEEIGRFSEEYGVTVGVENMPKFPILDAGTVERLLELVDGVDVGITFDVGHLNTTERDFKGFIDAFGERIVHVHLHDNRGERDEHLAPGRGNVPWKEFYPKLPKVTRALEVKDLDSGREGLRFLRNLH